MQHHKFELIKNERINAKVEIGENNVIKNKKNESIFESERKKKNFKQPMLFEYVNEKTAM